MTSQDDVIAQIEARLPEAVTLAVGRMVSGKIEARHLALDGDAANVLRQQCHIARDRISEGRPASYTATAELDTGEFFLIDDDATLAELSEFRRLGTNPGSFPQITPVELDMTIKLYVVALGDDSDRILFVQRADPRLRPKAGPLFAIARERLTRIEGPIFAFSVGFDFVLGPSWAVVLDQRSFEMLFRQIRLVERHVSTWIEGITAHLPMSATSIDSLRRIALRDSRTWRRLRDIERRGHLAQITLEQVGSYAIEVGLDPARVIVNGELVFDPAQRFGFLQLLNEDLYMGPLTGEAFESQRKSAMN